MCPRDDVPGGQGPGGEGGGDGADGQGGHDQHGVAEDRGVQAGLALVQPEAVLAEFGINRASACHPQRVL
jgi:hypothetical protein